MFARMFGFFRTSNYDRSRSITDVSFRVSDAARAYARQLLSVDGVVERQRLSDALLDELCDCAGIDIVRVTISDEHQVHKKRNGKLVYKQYGYYRPDQKFIYITNRTAVRGAPLAAKTFFDTLLHEWMHHYDFAKLGLQSIHSSGFYARVNDVKDKLGYAIYV